jgi:hypothetical protein
MRFPIFPLLLTVALVCGCEPTPQMQTTNKPVTPPDTTPAVVPAATPATTPADKTPVTSPDNSAVNARDDNVTAKTPIDQNENEADVKITAEIRKRVLEQPDFSVNARNVKIITADGKVTLRGPVTTEAERDSIKKIAEQVAGETKVESQLEIAP